MPLSGSLHGEQPRFGFQAASSKPLKLDLPYSGGICPPPRHRRLFDAKGCRELLLGAVVRDRFLCSHVCERMIGTPLFQCQ
jgi:hypothetical protein